MANLAPPLKFTAWDSSGNPLAGGKLYTYVAGTTTPKATYTDSGLGTPNANPVILNSRGEASVWLSGAYQLVLKDASDVTIYSQDNVTDALTNSTISGTLTISSTAVTWSGNPTHSGNHTFSGNVSVQGNTTLGNAGTDTVTTNGNITVNAPTSGNTVTVSQVSGAAAHVASAGISGAAVESQILNTSNTASSDARMFIRTAGSSAGDPKIGLQVSGAQDWSVGIDNSASDAFKISSNSSLGTNDQLEITTSGNKTFSAPSSGTTATLTVGALNGAAPLKLGPLTVANLPAAATAGAGSVGFVTDANATTFASVVAAGGANGVPVYCDGANWRIG